MEEIQNSDLFKYSPYKELNDSQRTAVEEILERIRSGWKYMEDGIRYEIETPVETEVIIGDTRKTIQKGKYIFGESV